MSWAVGYDSTWARDIGYGVPATCDHPDCGTRIDRGLAHVCGGDVRGGEHGCGLYFCSDHLYLDDGARQQCDRCSEGQPPFAPTPDVEEWTTHKATDPSWAAWRAEHGIPEPGLVASPKWEATIRDVSITIEVSGATRTLNVLRLLLDRGYLRRHNRRARRLGRRLRTEERNLHEAYRRRQIARRRRRRNR